VFPSLLRQFAAKYPRVRVKTVEAGAVDQLELLRRGDLHAAVGVLQGNEAEFVTHALPPIRLLFAYNPTSGLSFTATVEISQLVDVPLLLLRPGFGTRKTFDAACRLERVVPNVFLESTAPETLLALAREGHGAAIVPMTARVDRRSLRLATVTFRGSPLSIETAMVWSGGRRLPRYAEAFSAMLAEHMRAAMSQLRADDGNRRTTRSRMS